MPFPRFHLDFEQGILAVETSWDVRIAELPAAFQERQVGLQRAVLDIEADELLLFISDDIAATIELGVTEPRASDPLRGRRIVYLDQNGWSTMAAWRHAHRPVAPREAEAAERLYELVIGEEVVLPLSGGHAVETGPMYDVRRVAHAATLMELSRGWQMRNPVAVRTEELACALRGEAPIASDVFCLGSDVLFTQRLREINLMDAPELLASVSPRIVNLLSVYSALLDAEPVDNSDGLRKAEPVKPGETLRVGF